MGVKNSSPLAFVKIGERKYSFPHKFPSIQPLFCVEQRLPTGVLNEISTFETIKIWALKFSVLTIKYFRITLFIYREFLSIFSRSNIFFFKKCRWTVGICTVCFVSTYIWIIIINLLKKVSLQLILYVFIFSTWRLSLDSKGTVGYKQKIGAEIEFRNQMMCHLSLNTYIYLCTYLGSLHLSRMFNFILFFLMKCTYLQRHKNNQSPTSE